MPPTNHQTSVDVINRPIKKSELQELKELWRDNVSQLRIINIAAFCFHLAQGLLILSVTFNQQFSVVFINFGSQNGQLTTYALPALTIELKYLIVGYFFITALSHLLVATVLYRQYQENILRRHHSHRWVEYSLSLALMTVCLLLVSGIQLATTLIAVIALSIIIGISGNIMESINRKPDKINFWPLILGSIAGLTPWLIILLQGSWLASKELIWPTLSLLTTYGIVFVTFSLFPLLMYLSIKQIGIWKSYINTEVTYIAFGLLAKSVLAWMLCFSLLRLV